MRTLILIAFGVAFAACGGEGRKTDQDIAKAFNAPDPHAQAKMAEDSMKKMKEKAAKDAAEAQQKEWEALLVVPADAPTDMKAGCEAMIVAYDAFMQKRITGDELGRWNAVKEADLGKAGEACREGQEPKVPACQTNAFTHAPATYDATMVTQILADCRTKFGPPG
jgi:hypothetical protein